MLQPWGASRLCLVDADAGGEKRLSLAHGADSVNHRYVAGRGNARALSDEMAQLYCKISRKTLFTSKIAVL
jgi:hypothetical protein